jgi:aminopeptidase N
MKKYLIVIGALLVLASCGVDPIQVDDQIVVETIETTEPEIEIAEELPTERPVYREAETILTDLIHTRLEVEFDWAKSQMKGLAQITAKPHFYTSNLLILDAKGMIINSVGLGKTPLKYTYTDDILTIDLGREFSRNDPYTVTIDYIARPEERETGGSQAISSDKGLYFINPTGADGNKMPQIWTQGETEASSVWFPTIDSPNSKTTQEIFIKVDPKYTTLSNGKLISSQKSSDGMRIDHWKQDLAHAPYLFMMGVGEFKVVKDSYKRPDGSTMEVHYYVEPEWEQYARNIFGETPAMIKFFSQLTGVEYPWDKYHQIVVRDYVSGAMENTGAVIFGDFVYKNERELLDSDDNSTIAHELFHHWFGDLVTCESWSNLPLNESFANYSQYLWDEHRYGLDQADFYAEEETDGYFQSAQMGGHHDLIWYDFDDKEQMFDGHSYNKGGRILHMLRNYLGDEAFFAGMKNYLEKNKFKPAEFHQLRLAFEEVSGEDLNWFFNQWFLGSGHPILEYDQFVNNVDHQLEITISQRQNLELSPIYKVPMEIAVFDATGKHIHKVVVDELTEEIFLPFEGELVGYIYDYQQAILGIKREEKPREIYIHQYYNGERYMARLEGLKNGARGTTDASTQLILDALNDPFWGIREEAIALTTKLKEPKRAEAISKLIQLAANDPKSSIRAAALAKLGNLMEAEEVEQYYVKAISSDSSYSVISAALGALGQDNPEKAMALAEPFENEKSSKMLSEIGELYGGHAGPEKYDFFMNAINEGTVIGYDKLGLIGGFTVFVSKQEYEAYEKSYAFYDGLQSSKDVYTQMFLPQFVGYLAQSVDKKVDELNDELSAYEESNDVVLANTTRKTIANFKALGIKFETLQVKLEEKSAEEGEH